MARGWLEQPVWWQNEIEQFKGERDANVFPWTKGETAKEDTVINPLKLLKELTRGHLEETKMTLVEAKGCLSGQL